MASPRARDIITDLRQDHLARTILDRVEGGPYGSIGRMQQGGEGLYNTIMTQSGMSEDSRAKRQSRQTREIVSSQDTAMSAPPTVEWQEQLYRRLSGTPVYNSPATPFSNVPSDQGRYGDWSSSQPSPVSTTRSIPAAEGEPSRRRRRLEGPSLTAMHTQQRQEPPEIYEEDQYDEAVDALGHLSVDSNQEFRYHGRSAGLHLLAASDRTDDSQAKENGIWKFNMPRPQLDDDCHCLSFEQVNSRVKLPDIATQDHLITLYFTYVHHYFPIIHKASFLAAYHERSIDVPRPGNRREPMQSVTKLLLLAMFAFAARYAPDEFADGGDKSRAGDQFATDARRLLNTLYEDNRPSVCQALLLLGIREFGIGAAAQGWLWIGMGCRIAIDLGMNRDADKWKDGQGNDIFTPVEKQIRRQIWWACCIADKCSAVWLGRPVMYKKGDFDTPPPDLDLNEDQELWKPYPRDSLGPNFVPMAGHIMTCFRAQCKLSFIMSEIMSKVYPVKWSMDIPRRQLLDQLESALHTWMIELPDDLRYHESGSRVQPPPHVLVLHAEYYTSLLLLYRAFIRVRNDDQDHDPVHAKCFDVCRGAAAKISSIIMTFHETFGLKRSPPFLSVFLQCAGIMHILTLNRQPRDTQATIGLLQCIHALEEMQDVWPATTRVRNLLKGAKVQMDDLTALSETAGRPKRRAEEALGVEMPQGVFIPQPYHLQPVASGSGAGGSMSGAGGGMSSGLSPYGMTSSSPGPSYVPSYEWWPPLAGPGVSQSYPTDYGQYQAGQLVSPFTGLPNSLFGFDAGQISPEFMMQQDPSMQQAANMPYPPHPPRGDPRQPHDPR